jgi:hypothetical protein
MVAHVPGPLGQVLYPREVFIALLKSRGAYCSDRARMTGGRFRQLLSGSTALPRKLPLQSMTVHSDLRAL